MHKLELIILDTSASILQSILLAYTVTYCAEEKKKIKLILLIVFLFISQSQVFTGIFGDNWGATVVATHILGLCITIVFYKKNILNTIIAYSIIYSIMVILNITFGSLIFEYIRGILPAEYIDYEKIFLVYVPESILLLLCFKYINKIKQIHKLIIDEGFSIIFLIMSFFLDFILTFYIITLGEKSQLIKNIIYIVFFLFLLVILTYFWKIHQKSEQIYKLNEALEVKNNELRKIKHDYGAQISYLYGLCLMDRFDELKKSLKDIINNNESIPTAVEVSENQETLLSLALKPAIDRGIHVIIEEKCGFDLIDMDEMEYYRVISNIVNNAIKAMNGEGIIIAKSYEHLGNAVIKIENNGPKIQEHLFNNLFNMGFTTKENKDNSHGYGLSIVKDLVESNNGKIYVKSTDATTEFKIVLPTN